MDEIISQLSNVFSNALPGWEAQSKMINFKRPDPNQAAAENPDARKSAVLALLYPKHGELHTVLMLRNVYNGTHSGQVSFPGGKHELADESLWHTALREAKEEVGIDENQIVRLGEMTKVYIPPSKFMVTPFLAFTKETPVFSPDPIEVQKIIETPFSTFLNEENIRHKMIQTASSDFKMNIKYYNVNGETVWGATAMMISELVELIKLNNIPLNSSQK